MMLQIGETILGGRYEIEDLINVGGQVSADAGEPVHLH